MFYLISIFQVAWNHQLIQVWLKSGDEMNVHLPQTEEARAEADGFTKLLWGFLR